MLPGVFCHSPHIRFTLALFLILDLVDEHFDFVFSQVFGQHLPVLASTILKVDEGGSRSPGPQSMRASELETEVLA